MSNIIHTAGLLIWPLLACSVFAFAIIIERLLVLRRGRIFPNSAAHASNKPTLFEQIILPLVGNKTDILTTQAEQLGRQAVAKLNAHLNILLLIANIAPLLGLLGTVLGMIEVFEQLLGEGLKNRALLAGGIAKALTTTAIGLGISIPCFVAHRLLSNKVERLSVDLESATLAFIQKQSHAV